MEANGLPWWQNAGTREVADTCFICTVQLHPTLLHWGIGFTNMEIRRAVFVMPGLLKTTARLAVGECRGHMFISFLWEHPQVFAGRPEALESSPPPCGALSSTVAVTFAKPRDSTFSLLSNEEHVAPERSPMGMTGLLSDLGQFQIATETTEKLEANHQGVL